MSETCPFCGNPDCLSSQELDKSWWISGPCKDRQIAVLEAKLAEREHYQSKLEDENVQATSLWSGYLDENKLLKAQVQDLTKRLDAWRDLADIVRPMDELKAVQRLDELGEL